MLSRIHPSIHPYTHTPFPLYLFYVLKPIFLKLSTYGFHNFLFSYFLRNITISQYISHTNYKFTNLLIYRHYSIFYYVFSAYKNKFFFFTYLLKNYSNTNANILMLIISSIHSLLFFFDPKLSFLLYLFFLFPEPF